MISVSSRSSRSNRVAWWSVLVFLALMPWTPTASAQEVDVDAETRTAARELARQGVEAYEQGDNETALDRLDRAYALVPAPSISVVQARVLVRLGRWVEALDRYEKTRVFPLGSAAPDAFRQAVADAVTEGEALRARIPRLIVHVTTHSGSPDGLVVTLDGKPMPPELLDVQRPLDPGSHEVTASAPGYQPVERAVNLVEGEHKAVEIQLSPPRKPVQATKPEPPKTLAGPPQPMPHTDRTSTEEVAGWTVLGVGTAAIVAGTVTGLFALGKKSYLDKVCLVHSECPPHAEDEIHSFRLNRTVAYVSFAIGAASVTAGGYLLLAGTHDSSHIAADIGLHSVGLSGRF